MTPVEGVGTVLVTVQINDGHNERARLHQVLYMPALEMNLLSVYQAAQGGAKFEFHTRPGSVMMSLDHCHVTCRATNKLYVLHSARPPAALAVRPELTLDFLHQLFGHTSKQTLRKMASSKMVSGMAFKPEQKNSPCDTCELGTKRRATFKMKPRADLDGCNNVVHSDIAGPVELPSIKLERYVLLFVDGYSRYRTARLLRKRSEMFQCFLEYKSSIETKHNRSLRRFVSENGGEYLYGAFVKYCRDHGIQRDTTIAYIPEQNGMAEVYFRILFNKVRTILISSGSPKQLWGEAVLAMVYTYNRTLASGIGMIPYERWHGHPPDVSNLRTFGSLVYVYVASKTNAQGRAGAKRQKLDAKAVQVVFVGYAANQKGWKILDCNQGAIIPPIHVTFDESCSAAACDLKRQEFRKLASRDAMDFEYYSRTATSEVDLLFYSQHPTEEKPFTNDIVLLEFCCWL